MAETLDQPAAAVLYERNLLRRGSRFGAVQNYGALP
jgi:hypothetical protein